jgi:hypothetical protein
MYCFTLHEYGKAFKKPHLAFLLMDLPWASHHFLLTCVLKEIPQNATNTFATSSFFQLLCTLDHSCNYATITFATDDFFILHFKIVFIHDDIHMSYYLQMEPNLLTPLTCQNSPWWYTYRCIKKLFKCMCIFVKFYQGYNGGMFLLVYL